MNFSSNLVYLRAIEPEDLEYLYLLENNTSIWELSSTLVPFSRFALKQYIERSLSEDIYSLRELRLVICRNGDDAIIGLIDLFDFDPKNKRAGIGIIISNKTDRGLGYGSDALYILTTYSFRILNLHQLYCNILSENKQSINMFLKQGFKLIGTKKDWIFNDDKYKDELLFQLIKKQ